MAKVFPFKSIVPNKAYVGQVSTRSINTYTKKQLKKKHANPLSFVHVVQPDYNEADQSTANTTERYEKVKDKFNEFLANGYFVQEQDPVMYVYQQRFNDRSYTGIVAGASAKDYEDGIIKKHEDTLEKREEVFTEYLRVCGFNAEPVLLAHPAHEGLKDIIKKIIENQPEIFLQSGDGTLHNLWKISEENTIKAIQQCFSEMSSIYISDGHHRTASSHRLYQQTGEEFVLSYFISENEVDIYDFNRVIKNLNGLDKEQFLEKLSENFAITRESKPLTKPIKKGNFSLYIDNEFYTLSFKLDYLSFPTQKQLDAQILTDYILSPILGIHNLKNDDNIDFISGKHGLTSLKKAVDSGEFRLGVCLYPVSYDELTKIADNNLSMPPKSTWIEPKLRTGLTIYKFNS